MSQLLRKLLSRFLHLGIEEGADPQTDDPPPADDPPADETQDDDSLEGLMGGDEPPEPKDDPKERLTAAERRAEQAERELAAERAARQHAAPPAAAGRDPDYDREEAQIAQAQANGASETDLQWLRWQIGQSRENRATKRTAMDALTRATDIADKSDFDRLEITKPKTYKTYKDRVEKAIADARAGGQTNIPSRSVILKLMIGDDIMNNKIKPKTAKAATDGEAAPARVERTRLPATRSDVSGRAAQSERTKRMERLKDQLI